MSARWDWRVYDHNGDHVASCESLEDARSIAEKRKKGTRVTSIVVESFDVWVNGASKEENDLARELYDKRANLRPYNP